MLLGILAFSSICNHVDIIKLFSANLSIATMDIVLNQLPSVLYIE